MLLAAFPGPAPPLGSRTPLAAGAPHASPPPASHLHRARKETSKRRIGGSPLLPSLPGRGFQVSARDTATREGRVGGRVAGCSRSPLSGLPSALPRFSPGSLLHPELSLLALSLSVASPPRSLSFLSPSLKLLKMQPTSAAPRGHRGGREGHGGVAPAASRGAGRRPGSCSSGSLQPVCVRAGVRLPLSAASGGGSWAGSCGARLCASSRAGRGGRRVPVCFLFRLGKEL